MDNFSISLLKRVTCKLYIEDYARIKSTVFPSPLLKQRMYGYAKEARDVAHYLLYLEEKGTYPTPTIHEKGVVKIWEFARTCVWGACKIVKSMKLRADLLKNVTFIVKQFLATVKEAPPCHIEELVSSVVEAKGLILEMVGAVESKKTCLEFSDLLEEGKLSHYQIIQMYSTKNYGMAFEELHNEEKVTTLSSIIEASGRIHSIGLNVSKLKSPFLFNLVYVLLGTVTWELTTSRESYEKLKIAWSTMRGEYAAGVFITELVAASRDAGLVNSTASEKSALSETLAGGLLSDITAAVISPHVTSHFDLIFSLLCYEVPAGLRLSNISFVKFMFNDAPTLLS